MKPEVRVLLQLISRATWSHDRYLKSHPHYKSLTLLEFRPLGIRLHIATILCSLSLVLIHCVETCKNLCQGTCTSQPPPPQKFLAKDSSSQIGAISRGRLQKFALFWPLNFQSLCGRARGACQTLSGPLPQSGSPAREARGAAAAAPQGAFHCFQRENGPQRQATRRAKGSGQSNYARIKDRCCAQRAMRVW